MKNRSDSRIVRYEEHPLDILNKQINKSTHTTRVKKWLVQ